MPGHVHSQTIECCPLQPPTAAGLVAEANVGRHERIGNLLRFAGITHLMAIAVIAVLWALAQLHGMLIGPLRRVLCIEGGPLFFAWVVPGAAFAVVFALIYARFVRRLPARTGRLFVLAGLVHIAGAVGMELLGGNYAASIDTKRFGYSLLASAEETLEVAGVLLLVYAMLDFMPRNLFPVEPKPTRSDSKRLVRKPTSRDTRTAA